MSARLTRDCRFASVPLGDTRARRGFTAGVRPQSATLTEEASAQGEHHCLSAIAGR